VVASAVSGVFSLPSDLPVQDAASFFVNPYTALAIFDTARAEGTKAFVHTAAASQLGQMIVKLSLTPTMAGMEVINVVRREEQAELLREIGAKHIVVTGSGEDDDSWKKELASKIKELGATVAFDAVAGRSTGDLLDALPKKGTVYVYGGLAGKVGNIDPMALIYHGKKVKGFFLSNWIAQGGTLGTVPRMMKAGANVNSGLNQGGWSSTQFKDTTLENAQGDISTLLNGSITGQKLRIRLDEVV
jgi:NADPH:quinone reductase-like Zn-dependent oxidoreductase